MDEVKEKKNRIRSDMAKMVETLSEDELMRKIMIIEERLFEFANFVEARVPMLYMNYGSEVPTGQIIRRCFAENKVVVLPAFNEKKHSMTLYKVDDFDTDLKPGPRGVLEPDPSRCKRVPLDKVDIAIIPGITFDEKGGRVGSGMGYYDRLLPRLPATTRKVSLCLESQMVSQVPHVDIIITDERVVYKI